LLFYPIFTFAFDLKMNFLSYFLLLLLQQKNKSCSAKRKETYALSNATPARLGNSSAKATP
jgi:hypothetical protein